jgi:hypothetical protein
MAQDESKGISKFKEEALQKELKSFIDNNTGRLNFSTIGSQKEGKSGWFAIKGRD